MTHDIEILDILDELEVTNYSSTLWRTTWKTRDPLLGGSGGGRWSPKRKFEALYTSLGKNISIAELHYHLSRAPVFSSCSMLICKLSVSDLRLLDLSDIKLLDQLNVEKSHIEQSQKIGAASHFLGYDGIIVPSYRRLGKNCVIFSEVIDLEQLQVEAKEEINWPAWIEKHNLS